MSDIQGLSDSVASCYTLPSSAPDLHLFNFFLFCFAFHYADTRRMLGERFSTLGSRVSNGGGAPAKNAKQSVLSVLRECQHKQVVPETSRIRFACIIHVKISIALSWPYTGNMRLSVEMKAQRYIECS